jgi:hypothetical protein
MLRFARFPLRDRKALGKFSAQSIKVCTDTARNIHMYVGVVHREASILYLFGIIREVINRYQ